MEARAVFSLINSRYTSNNALGFHRVYLKNPFPQNLSNYYAHFDGTGPEIWRQTDGIINAFVSGAGAYDDKPRISSSHGRRFFVQGRVGR